MLLLARNACLFFMCGCILLMHAFMWPSMLYEHLQNEIIALDLVITAVSQMFAFGKRQSICTCGDVQGDAGLRVRETRADAAADSRAGVAVDCRTGAAVPPAAAISGTTSAYTIGTLITKACQWMVTQC